MSQGKSTAHGLRRSVPGIRLASELAGPAGRCPKCRGRIDQIPLTRVQGHSRRRCSACKKDLGIVVESLGLHAERAWAQSFILTFGPYRGHTIGELAQTARGREQLRTLSGFVRSEASIAARVMLDALGVGGPS